MLLGSWQVEIVLEKKDVTQPLLVNQEHGNQIVRYFDVQLQQQTVADGIWTEITNKQAVGIYTADCLPLLVATKTAAVLLHVSRKSLIAGLLEAVPQYIDVSQIQWVWFGPHICDKHFVFEWLRPSIKEFQEKFPAAIHKEASGYQLSLIHAVQTYLTQWKVSTHIVPADKRCTYEDASLYSYKRHWDQTHTKLTSRMITTVTPVL